MCWVALSVTEHEDLYRGALLCLIVVTFAAKDHRSASTFLTHIVVQSVVFFQTFSQFVFPMAWVELFAFAFALVALRLVRFSALTEFLAYHKPIYF